jgi:hypothetical protein
MSGLAGAEQSFDAGHGARGAHAQGFVEQQNAVDIARSLSEYFA